MRRSLGIALVVFLAGASRSRAGVDDAPRLLPRARGSSAVTLESIARLDRYGTHEAIDRLLDSGDEEAVHLAERLATAYASVHGERAPLDRVLRYRSWPPARRASFRDAVALLLQGRRDRIDGHLQKSRDELSRALSLAEDIGDGPLIARCLLGLASLDASRRKLDAALTSLSRGASLAREAGDRRLGAENEMVRAWALIGGGRIDEAGSAAANALAEARAVGDGRVEAEAMVAAGEVEIISGDPAAAIAGLEGAATLAHRLGASDTESAALHRIGRAYQRLGETKRAETLMRRAAERARQSGAGPTEFSARLNLVSFLVESGRTAAAREQLERARVLAGIIDSPLARPRVAMLAAHLALLEGNYSTVLRETADALDALAKETSPITESDALALRGAALSFLGRYEEAVASFERAVERSRSAGRRDQESQRRVELGFELMRVGDYERALAEIENGRRLSEESGDDVGACRTRAQLGRVRLSAGDTAGGTADLEEALRCMPAEGWTRERGAILSALAHWDISRSPEALSRRLERLAEARVLLEQAGDPDGIVSVDVTETEIHLETGNAVSARRALERSARIRLEDLSADVQWEYNYLDAVLDVEEKQLDRARVACERAVAGVEALRGATRDAYPRAIVAADTVEPYRLLTRLHLARGKPVEAWSVGRRGKAHAFSEKIQSWTAADRTPGAGSAGSSLKEIQDSLSESEVLVDFIRTDRSLVAFVVGRRAFVARVLPVPLVEVDELSAATRHPGLPDSADRPITEAWRSNVARLGEALFGPLAQDVTGARRLLVVPTGPLHSVPFGALAVGGRPLAEAYAVAILPSAETILARRHPRGPARGALVIGDPDVGSRGTRLPAAAREARSVAQRLGPGSTVFTGNEATEAVWRERAPLAAVVHVAAHGRVDLVRPSRSRLDLAADGDDDGALTAREIASTPLNGSLVVLSGCATALDASLGLRTAPGDEREGLVRALLAAGASTVVATLWELDDEAAARIMPELYARLPAGGDPAAAIARLQVDLASGRIAAPDEPSFDHPFFWASLAVYGAGR